MKSRSCFIKHGLRVMIAWCMINFGTVSAWANAHTKYPWSHDNVPEGATLLDQNGEAILRIENTTSTPLTVRLATISNPVLSPGMAYQVTGAVRYESVEGKAYLETWNYIPREGDPKQVDPFFSRTLNPSGEMGILSGSSGWRRFILPFYPKKIPPLKIDFNLVMPNKGTVYLRGFEIKEGVSLPENRGWIWGMAGGALGIYCAICMTLAGRARARTLVIPTIVGAIAVSIILLGYGIYLLAGRHAFLDWYPPMLQGGLGILLLPILLMRSRHLYELAELRRMSAKDMVSN